MMKDEPIVVYITAPSVEVGKEIATALINEKLAACVNILAPVLSLYLWENKTHEDHEVLLMIKSRSTLLEERIIPAVLAVHPYKLPEIIAVPVVAGYAPYLRWIEQETSQDGIQE